MASLGLRQTTRLLVNKTTSGGFAGGYANASPELRNYGSTELRRASLRFARQRTTELRLRCASPDDYVDL